MSVTTSGLQSKSSHGASKRAVELLSSMRFAIALLVVLSIASIIGTVLTQDDPYPNYVNQFGPFWADIFRSLGLYNVYSAWWFMLILIFLVVSISLCVIRNAPKMLADAKSWKDKVREGSLRAFHHKAEYTAPGTRASVAATLATFVAKAGYKHVVRETDGATLISAKRGAMTKWGYISAHLAIVVICIGGLLDSNLPIKFQMLMFGKSPVNTSATISEISPDHRLSASNPTFRGYAWVPEGQFVSTAILNQPSGSLIQDLPFSIQLDKFIVDYYTTGMPKLFASDIVVIDRETGRKIPARVEVNKPFTYKGVSIYQSSFQDGGSQMQMTAYPMTGSRAATVPVKGTIGSSAPLQVPGADGETIEFSDFRAINVENMADANGKPDVRGVATTSSLKEVFDERLGSGAKTSKPTQLHNIGPSVQYKIRGKDGQAREFNNYMLPVDMNGERVFLAGVRASPNDPFRYMRIPADSQDSIGEWMRLRAALEDPAVRTEAAARFAQRSLPGDASLRGRLQDSASKVLTLFAASDDSVGRGADGQPVGGFQAVATFIDRSVPKGEQEKAASLLLRMLEGSMWEVWQIARERAGEPAAQQGTDTIRFVQNAINALSDSFLYGSPVYLQLDSFKQVQASVFQLTRAPGKNLVYLGSLLLVAGIFSMFYVRERRLWFWLKDAGSGVDVVMAMSTARKTFDFEKEFVQTRDAAGAALRAAPRDAAPAGAASTARPPAGGGSDSENSTR
ncbi:cytochrome c biogenesis protein ResB [Burkholderia semiarida]|uniref:cytochrome c biogenesis protein ResB n=1 Tax=Burkholderia TaxID=32008 RepID=UPI001CF3E919|nr:MULTISPECIES: cytochrome c biogenesis protein ResB [Burkholderia]MCA8034125.1 cytochrome c biogenesis protein ResB [Burkholderia arboris]MDN7702989.1 cytochrome c biogenesis protein ResB [Burkholderia sp. AU44665]